MNLVQYSKTQEGRADMLRFLPSICEGLTIETYYNLDSLRILRNSCAGVSENVKFVCDSKVLLRLCEHCKDIMFVEASMSGGIASEFLVLVAQIIANVAASGEFGREYIFNDLGEESIQSLAVCIISRGKHSNLRFIFALLYNSVASDVAASDARLRALCSWRGLSSQLLLGFLLPSSADRDSEEYQDYFYWYILLVSRILDSGLAPEWIVCVGASDPRTISHEQIIVFQSILMIFDQNPKLFESAVWLFDLLPLCSKLLLTGVHACRVAPESNPESISSVHELIATMLSLVPGDEKGTTLRTALSQLTNADSGMNLLSFCLDELVRSMNSEGVDLSRNETIDFSLQLLGNLLYKCRYVQETLKELDAFPILLHYCATNFSNPTQREWGLICIRNACEDNQENQFFFRQLQLQGVEIVNEKWKELGISVDVNYDTGKFRFIVPDKSP